MIKAKYLLLLILFLFTHQLKGQTGSLAVETRIPEHLEKKARPSGRIFLFVSGSSGYEPRLSTWPGGSTKIYATNLENWEAGQAFTFHAGTSLAGTSEVSLDEIPEGKYRLQVLWDQNRIASQINAPGNFYSQVEFIELRGDLRVKIPLDNITEQEQLAEHPLLREVNFKSTVLSEFWNRDVYLKAAVLLPPDFSEEPKRKYPVRYNIAGFGGRYTRANRFVKWDQEFLRWWQSDQAPRIINVFLDGEGPFGDCYQLNSENSGPYGTALVEELIPAIEKKFRGRGTPEFRLLDGCSTGGWVSLALQLFYPDFFGGCFSYSPDPVDFENFQLINIYRDENAFYNEHGYLRPLVRDITGEPSVSQQRFIRYENVLGHTNSYITSGGQFGAFNALFSPKGGDGLPKPLFDPVTGKMDHQVAAHWRKYDLKHYVETHWKKLGPKINGKLWVWMGDMDDFYLNPALRSFDEMLKKMRNPRSDAVIRFSPMKGHCSEYNHKKVLLQMAEKLNMP